jgi:hypothetical protein
MLAAYFLVWRNLDMWKICCKARAGQLIEI